MSSFEDAQRALIDRPMRWLVTGSAGFIGSHLVEALLRLHQNVVSVDNFSTGTQRNLDEIRAIVGERAWKAHRFIQGDIVDADICREACAGRDVVLHQAALGSVPRSISDPCATHAANVTGTINLLFAAKEAGIKRFVYASSSSVYGDHPDLPKSEPYIGDALSPYAVSKRACELYAQVWTECYGIETIGLRYFNVFGPRQDPEGAYAAVIPRWVRAMLLGEAVVVNGDGETTRDFCYVANVVQANLLAAVTERLRAPSATINVAGGSRVSLNHLIALLQELLGPDFPQALGHRPSYRAFRIGDIRHSEANISAARELLGFVPIHDLKTGLTLALPWYVQRFAAAAPAQYPGAG